MISQIRKNIVKIRKEKGLTQRDLSKISGISQRLIAYYEKEVKQIPSDNLIKLIKSLKVNADELLGLKKIKENITSEESKILKKISKLSKSD